MKILPQAVNLVLDTSSCTLAVHDGCYQPQEDTALKPTPYEQDVCYGMGGWYGPVVKTHVLLYGIRLSLHLDEVNSGDRVRRKPQRY